MARQPMEYRVVVQGFATRKILYRSHWTRDWWKARENLRCRRLSECPNDVWMDERPARA